MTFLSKLGKVLGTIVNIAGIAAGIGPILKPFLGSKVGGAVQTGINDLTAIGSTVLQAETLIQAPGSGAAKLQAATPLVASIVQTSELVSGRKIANEALFEQGCAKITSGTADCLNALDHGDIPNPKNSPAAPVTA